MGFKNPGEGGWLLGHINPLKIRKNSCTGANDGKVKLFFRCLQIKNGIIFAMMNSFKVSADRVHVTD